MSDNVRSLPSRSGGAVNFEMGLDLKNPGRLIVQFDRQVQWIGLTPDEARHMAHGLIQLAAKSEAC